MNETHPPQKNEYGESHSSKTKKNKIIKKMILKKLERRMKTRLHKLDDQYNDLVNISKYLNSVEIGNNMQLFKKLANKISKKIRIANEENNDDIAILKIERDLIRSNIVNNKKGLKTYNKDEQQLEDDECIENETEKNAKYEKRKKKKKKTSHSHSSHSYVNSVTPLQIFHDNNLCMNNKCYHNDFLFDNLKIKNSIIMDLFNALAKNKYFKETNCCDQMFDQSNNSIIYKKEKKKLKKKRKLLHSVFFNNDKNKKKKRKLTNEKDKLNNEMEGIHVDGKVGENINPNNVTEYISEQNASPPLGVDGCIPNSSEVEKEVFKNINSNKINIKSNNRNFSSFNDSNFYNSSNFVVDNNKNRAYWISMKKEINKNVCETNTKTITSNILTFFSSISKIFYCEVIDKKKDKLYINDDIKNQKRNRFYEYAISDGCYLSNPKKFIYEKNCENNEEEYYNTHNDHNGFEKNNYIYIYVKREYIPEKLLNLKKNHKIKLILNFPFNDLDMFYKGRVKKNEQNEKNWNISFSSNSKKHGSDDVAKTNMKDCIKKEETCNEKGKKNGEDEDHDEDYYEERQGHGCISTDDNHSLEKKQEKKNIKNENENNFDKYNIQVGSCIYKYKNIFNRSKYKKKKKKKNNINTIIAMDDCYLFNNIYLNYLNKKDSHDKKKYNYCDVDILEYDPANYDVEDIMIHLEKIIKKKTKYSIPSSPFTPSFLLNYINKKYALYYIKGNKKTKIIYNKKDRMRDYEMKKMKKIEYNKIKKEKEAEMNNNNNESNYGQTLSQNNDNTLNKKNISKNQIKNVSNNKHELYNKRKSVSKKANQTDSYNSKKKEREKKKKNIFFVFDNEMLMHTGMINKNWNDTGSNFTENNYSNNFNSEQSNLQNGNQLKKEVIETEYLMIYNHMLSYNNCSDEIILKYYICHIENRDFNFEIRNKYIPIGVLHFYDYYLDRKTRLEKTLKEHSKVYKEIYKLWKEDIDIHEKEREKKNIFAWGILPVRAYDHPNMFVPLPCGFKHNNKNLAYNILTTNDKNSNYDDNLLEKKEKKKEYMNIKYANLTGPCVNWRKHCIFFNDTKTNRFFHFSSIYPYYYCMQNIMLSIFSLERNVIYNNTNNILKIKPDDQNSADNSMCKHENQDKLYIENTLNNTLNKKIEGNSRHNSVHVNEPSQYFSNENILYEKNNIWNKQEIRIFLDKYFTYPKNFEKISQYLEFKNTRQCVDFYYTTKNFFNLKKILLTLTESKIKRPKKCLASVNDVSKKNLKEEIVNKLLKKLENNNMKTEFEESNYVNCNYISMRIFFKKLFEKTYKNMSGKNLQNKAPINKHNYYNNSLSKGILLENMSDGYIVPQNYNFILSSNRKLCFLIKNDEDIYQGVNSDIVEIKYNDNLEDDKKKDDKKKKNNNAHNAKKISDAISVGSLNNTSPQKYTTIEMNPNYNDNEINIDKNDHGQCSFKKSNTVNQSLNFSNNYHENNKKMNNRNNIISSYPQKNNTNNEYSCSHYPQNEKNHLLKNESSQETLEVERGKTNIYAENLDPHNNIDHYNKNYQYGKGNNHSYINGHQNTIENNMEDSRTELGYNNNEQNPNVNRNLCGKNAQIEACEESLYKCFEFLKNMNQRNSENLNKNYAASQKSASLYFDCKLKKGIKKKILKKKKILAQQKEKIVSKNGTSKVNITNSVSEKKGKNNRTNKRPIQELSEYNMSKKKLLNRVKSYNGNDAIRSNNKLGNIYEKTNNGKTTENIYYNEENTKHKKNNKYASQTEGNYKEIDYREYAQKLKDEIRMKYAKKNNNAHVNKNKDIYNGNYDENYYYDKVERKGNISYEGAGPICNYSEMDYKNGNIIGNSYMPLDINNTNPYYNMGLGNNKNTSDNSKSAMVHSLNHQQMENYDDEFLDPLKSNAQRKTATKWTDREKEIYFDTFSKDGKNWDSLFLALKSFGKTKDQIKNFYQNSIVRRRKGDML
ncbi:conserved Plasmodium protein, unknown function [Plasmodium berghei]|uniref:SANT domain-containing protein n=2 Tax=Plasmodium berghei TaxID=5821 RepID=A0A509AID2_PLABA|nr:conserved Plasmodium protein, unknown function [Plasmodium berghei ANKA]CXI43529.1 conserved Plasmodium protein, unknown function [Plasmodium berghei]SCM22334.1 conserved Plasmodium protein, unknown function [Plasmodium berghei]SCN25389.1 conserved Plasmodium protein, unknown function [Plasmodium berghei]SCO60366.1 conserved Plasmodium protein, unknown function [Plasmodium berghei]VUC55793.1 conserved Plasmodium protein, unknown function [Plasmodium berghei ANKA]|eukprot:XP_034421603.1 conserved Plasmodium protein, unknown function [Plasmodium berghei ANKA]